MTMFMTRVELHNGKESDYQTLHCAMAAKGFKRDIKSDSGNLYKLPNAEYFVDTNNNIEDVLNSAKSAADQTRLSNAIVVNQSNSIRWNGLHKML